MYLPRGVGEAGARCAVRGARCEVRGARCAGGAREVGREVRAGAEHVLALLVGREGDGHDVTEEGQQNERHVDERHARRHQLDAALRQKRECDGNEGGDGQRARQPQQQHAHEHEVVERHQRVVLP